MIYLINKSFLLSHFLLPNNEGVLIYVHVKDETESRALKRILYLANVESYDESNLIFTIRFTKLKQLERVIPYINRMFKDLMFDKPYDYFEIDKTCIKYFNV